MDKTENIRMVACDLDGTLLNGFSKITEKTRHTIRALRRQGIVFGICSGRSAVALKDLVKIWGIEKDVDFVLGFNGGMLWDPKTGEFEEWLTFPGSQIPKTAKLFEGYPVWFAQYCGKETLCTKEDFITRRFARRNHLSLRKTTLEEMSQNDTGKFMAVGMPWTISRFQKEHPTSTGEYRMIRSGPFLLEVVNPALSKLEGVRRVAQRLDIPLDQVMTFGNDNNDLEMLEGTVGVAMANALPQVKKAARYIAPRNTKDGVARFLQEHVLQQSQSAS